MSMRMISWVGALAIGACCPGPVGPKGGEFVQDLRPPPELLICPDGTTNCTNPNGTGIYTDERGAAAIGPFQLMITHFINLPGSPPAQSRVAFDGRIFDFQTSQSWGPLLSPGAVVRADYDGKHELPVLAVTETSTQLQWTLLDPQTSQPFTVSDSQLAKLTVYVQFLLDRKNGTNLFALQFQPMGGPAGTPPVRGYRLTWRDPREPSAPPIPYCVDAQGQPDPVVFQRGIDVDPATGKVDRAAGSGNLVTMSCRKGALATVYSWGYGYGAASSTPPAGTFYFDAGIQMKRASYCGDAQFFTVAGTDLYMTDDRGIQRATPPPSSIEAWWTPTGAACVNLANLRHRSMGFQGSCNGAALAACPAVLPGAPYLGDAPKHPGP